VLRYAPILNQRMRREVRHPNRSWRVDETYVCIAGRWSYLYRAVDSTGETIDFVLSPNRDLIAAKLFLRLALSGAGGIRPRVINVDGHPTYARAIAELKESGDLSRSCRCRPSPYLNNIIEQDHGFIKKRITASLGLRSVDGAWRTIEDTRRCTRSGRGRFGGWARATRQGSDNSFTAFSESQPNTQTKPPLLSIATSICNRSLLPAWQITVASRPRSTERCST
jgi:transposase, IS6 family